MSQKGSLPFGYFQPHTRWDGSPIPQGRTRITMTGTQTMQGMFNEFLRYVEQTVHDRDDVTLATGSAFIYGAEGITIRLTLKSVKAPRRKPFLVSLSGETIDEAMADLDRAVLRAL